MEFGPEIKVDGKRPEWLKDGTETIVNDDIVTDPGSVFGDYASGRNWRNIRTIRLPANHPHYNLTTHTYAVRPEDEAALLASDPLSRSTPTPDERAVAPGLVTRLVELARSVSTSPECTIAHTVEAQNILAALEPVDGDLVVARECVSKEYQKMGRADLSRQVIAGKMDGRLRVQAALAALARGRQLEKEGK